MFGALKKLAKGSKPVDSQRPEAMPGLSRSKNGQLKPTGADNGEEPMADKTTDQNQDTTSEDAANGSAQGGASENGAGGAAPSTSALNQQVVQAATFTNYENAEYAPTMVATPPELMVGQTTGLAIQDAANYMNAIMQIAVAAQAVAIKQAAENPALAAKEIPLLTDIQDMVTQAVTVYGTVSTTAATSSQTVISDFKSG